MLGGANPCFEGETRAKYPAELSQRTRPPTLPLVDVAVPLLTVTLRLRGSVLRYAAVTIYAGGERSTSSTVSVIRVTVLCRAQAMRLSRRNVISHECPKLARSTASRTFLLDAFVH